MDWATVYPMVNPDEIRSFEYKLLEFIHAALKERLLLMTYFEQHPEERAAELEKCDNDVVYWANRWAWTQDTRLTRFGAPADIPLFLLPFQADYLEWVDEGIAKAVGGICEKTRGMGASWVSMCKATHMMLTPRWRSALIGVGSRKVDLVDVRGDTDSLIEKCRYIIGKLPQWMGEAYLGEWDGKNYAHFDDKWCFLQNTKTGAAIKGEGGDEMGRGGRKVVYFVDEHAFIERAEKIEAALSSNSPSIVRVSTPHGMGNQFATIRHRPGTRVFTMHWKANPLCDDEWYAHEAAKIEDPVIVAQELDMNYSGSVDSIAIPPEWVQAAVEFELEKSEPLVLGLDVAGSGANKNAWALRQGSIITDVKLWQGTDDTQTTAELAAADASDLGAQYLVFDAIGIGTGIGGSLKRYTDATFEPRAFVSSKAPSDVTDRSGRKAKDMFLNMRAQAWWGVRLRFLRTYRQVNGLETYEAEDLISIPKHTELINQLSYPKHSRTSVGKIKIESKDDMRKRGVLSPDIADALVMCFVVDLIPRTFVGTTTLDTEEQEAETYSARKAIAERARQRKRSDLRGAISNRHRRLTNVSY